jgi:hypothetical protein
MLAGIDCVVDREQLGLSEGKKAGMGQIYGEQRRRKKDGRKEVEFDATDLPFAHFPFFVHITFAAHRSLPPPIAEPWRKVMANRRIPTAMGARILLPPYSDPTGILLLPNSHAALQTPRKQVNSANSEPRRRIETQDVRPKTKFAIHPEEGHQR